MSIGWGVKMACREHLRKHWNETNAFFSPLDSLNRPRGGWQGLLAWCLSIFLLTGCGYRLAGSGQLPGDVKTIAVQVFTNRTAESGLETTVTNAVIDELTRRRQDLVVEVGEAEGILSGTIGRLTTATVSRSGTLTALERKVVVTASFVLKDPNGKTLWQRGAVSAEQAYAVEDSKSATDMNRRLAIGLAAQRLAESFYVSLTDSF